jgi:putative endonuclease
MADHNILGKKGEELAAEFLSEKGYEILETNWAQSGTEIDIVARTANTLVIVEVKTRKGNYFGEPEAFVNKAKQKNLIKGAGAYVQRNNLDTEVRFDIVSVIHPPSGEVKIQHIEDAFYPLIK